MRQLPRGHYFMLLYDACNVVVSGGKVEVWGEEVKELSPLCVLKTLHSNFIRFKGASPLPLRYCSLMAAGEMEGATWPKLPGLGIALGELGCTVTRGSGAISIGEKSQTESRSTATAAGLPLEVLRLEGREKATSDSRMEDGDVQISSSSLPSLTAGEGRGVAACAGRPRFLQALFVFNSA